MAPAPWSFIVDGMPGRVAWVLGALALLAVSIGPSHWRSWAGPVAIYLAITTFGTASLLWIAPDYYRNPTVLEVQAPAAGILLACGVACCSLIAMTRRRSA
jgi:hypothetical protein